MMNNIEVSGALEVEGVLLEEKTIDSASEGDLNQRVVMPEWLNVEIGPESEKNECVIALEVPDSYCVFALGALDSYSGQWAPEYGLPDRK